MCSLFFNLTYFSSFLFPPPRTPLEYCLFACIGGLAFIFGTPLLGGWAVTVFHPSTYFLYLFCTVGITWAYNFALWNTKFVEDRDKNGGKVSPV